MAHAILNFHFDFLTTSLIVVLVAVFFVPFVISNLTISARVHFCRSRRFFLLRLVQALLQVDTSKQDLFILDEDASMRQRWMLHWSYMLFVNSWYGKSGWRWICHRKASHILWMNYECRELSIIYNAYICCLSNHGMAQGDGLEMNVSQKGIPYPVNELWM